MVFPAIVLSELTGSSCIGFQNRAVSSPTWTHQRWNHGPPTCKAGLLPLSYGPSFATSLLEQFPLPSMMETSLLGWQGWARWQLDGSCVLLLHACVLGRRCMLSELLWLTLGYLKTRDCHVNSRWCNTPVLPWQLCAPSSRQLICSIRQGCKETLLVPSGAFGQFWWGKTWIIPGNKVEPNAVLTSLRQDLLTVPSRLWFPGPGFSRRD